MKTRQAQEKAYLSGAIDLAPDFGVDWRKMLIPKLKTLEIDSYDPTRLNLKVLKVRSMKKAAQIMRKLWEEDRGQWLGLVLLLEKTNLKALLSSSIVITCWDPRLSTYGTSIENFLAANSGIPIYCVHYTPVEALPGLLRKDVIQSLGEFFPNFDELLKFLKVRKRKIEQNSNHFRGCKGSGGSCRQQCRKSARHTR